VIGVVSSKNVGLPNQSTMLFVSIFGAVEVYVIFDEVANENIAVRGKLISDIPEAQGRAISAADVTRKAGQA
jgi:uncharacterized protein involved in propanediol utilization